MRDLNGNHQSFMKKTIVLIFTILLLLAIGFVMFNPLIGKTFAGTARNVGSETRSTIYIDDKEELNAKVFVLKSDFSGIQNKDYVILYLRNTRRKEFPVIVIDKKRGLVTLPNASKTDYNIVFGHLYQSDSGANVMIPINDDLKGLGFEPELEITLKKITFKIPFKGRQSLVVINLA